MDNAESHPDIVKKFCDKAKLAGAEIQYPATMEEALQYAAGLALKETQPIIGAPGFDQEYMDLLEEMSGEKNVNCITDDLRKHSSGIGVGLTRCDYGIAETGTLVINCPGEDLRLATMICDYHVCLVKASQIVPDSFTIRDDLNRFMKSTPDYTAFITGPSRTADIERVLTIGVHGPLELHILLMEG